MKKTYETPQITIYVYKDKEITLSMSDHNLADLLTCYSVDPEE